ncbi:MAG: hypothetical protein BWX50_01659 [Euryarchaeota archaeon ADurb.Bin009]|nr:MAG: hypothetical protein BWX50_01659 [Euryarchaeota archaeon ADurb.Bin009]
MGEDDPWVHPGIVLRPAGEVFLRAVDVVVGVIAHPGVIGRRVVRDEVEHEEEVVPVQPFAEPLERLRLSEVRVEAVGGDGKRRAADVVLPDIGDQAPVAAEPLLV